MLRLITPEKAQELGIPAEHPVFVSGYIDQPEICGDCNVSFGPLVYQVGYTTTSQHYHEGVLDKGGIFTYRRKTDLLLESQIYEGCRFIALVVPLGASFEKKIFTPASFGGEITEVRSEGALTVAIKSAFDEFPITDRLKPLTEFRRGYLEENSEKGFLLPRMVNDYRAKTDTRRYFFEINDSGEMYITDQF